MQREIKFRAWDGKQFVNQFKYSCIGLTLDGDAVEMYNEGSHYGWDYKDNLILSQFTGLHDKNGKEIYEGDVVTGRYMIQRSLDPDAKPEIVPFEGVVSYAEGCYFVKGKHGQCSFSFTYPDYDIEVIGNIYENPELIA